MLPDTHVEAIQLKKQQISVFKYIALLFFVTELCYDVYKLMVNNIQYFFDNEYLEEWIILARMGI
jgi:hypothetical protein